MIRGVAAAAMAIVVAAAAIPAHGETVRIDVKGLAFVPAEVTAHVGDTVEWVNEDFLVHTATARDHAWEEVRLPAHESGRTVLTKAGTVEYFCRIHPNMKGRIVVQPR